jgi:hypothetical protein
LDHRLGKNEVFQPVFEEFFSLFGKVYSIQSGFHCNRDSKKALLISAMIQRWKHHRAVLLLAGVLLTSACLALVGCFEKLLAPVAPVWDVQLNVPLVNRTYTVSQLVEKDSTLLHSDPSGLVVYSNSQQFSPISVRNDLKVDPASDTYESRIGMFKIKSPPSKVARLSAGDLNPALGNSQGQLVAIPPFSFSFVGQALPTVREVERGTISSGQVVMTLVNNMPFPIENISLTVQSQLGRVLEYTHAAPIQSRDSVKQTYSLAGMTIGNLLSFDFSGHVPGGGSAVIDTSSAVLVRLDFPTVIQASSAVAELPANTISTSRGFSLDDSTRIDYAKIGTGSMTVTLNNALGLSGEVSFVIPELQEPGGGAFTEVIPIRTSQQTIRVVYPLAGYSVQSPNGRLSYNVTTQTDDTGDNMVTMDSSMKVFGSVTTSAIYFDKFQGTFKPTNISMNVSRSVDLGEMNRIFTGTAKFSQARVVLTVTNPTQFAVDLNATVTGRSTLTGQSANLSIPQDQRRVLYPQTTIVLDQTNSNIVSFLNSFSGKLPDEFTIVGDALLNPDYVSGSVSGNDSVGIAFSIELPLTVGILNGIARDTTNIDISSETRKDIDRASYGKVTFEVANGLPSSIELTLDMLDSQRKKLLTLPKAVQAPVAVSAAPVDALGRVVVPAASTTYLELMSDDIDKIQQTQYVVYSLSIETSSGGTVPVQFLTTDSVHVRAYSTLNYRVNSK